jgi:DNA-binding CsgD family transcriptional regulator
VKAKQKLLYGKLLDRGWTPEDAAAYSAEMIEGGYSAKDLAAFEMPSIDVLRAKSTERSRSDSGDKSDEHFKIAEKLARATMNGRPSGMSYDDLLQVGIDVIMHERHRDGAKLHDKDLERAINRRIVREKKRWRKRNSITADVGDADQPRDLARRGGGLAPVVAPRPSRADGADGDPRLAVLRGLCAPLSKEQRGVLHWLAQGLTQSRAAEKMGMSQAAVSALLKKLRKQAANH